MRNAAYLVSMSSILSNYDEKDQSGLEKVMAEMDALQVLGNWKVKLRQFYLSWG